MVSRRWAGEAPPSDPALGWGLSLREPRGVTEREPSKAVGDAARIALAVSVCECECVSGDGEWCECVNV